MIAADLPAVGRIADLVHQAYPESDAVAAERLALFPEGCLVLGEIPIGYLVSHPGLLGRPPPLDCLLGRLPEGPDCLYLHDIALLPEARGRDAGAAALDILLEVARRHRLGHMALTAVHGTPPYWRGLGFRTFEGDDRLVAKLASYDQQAAYMVRTIG